MIQIINKAKEILREFEKEFVYIPLRYSDIVIVSNVFIDKNTTFKGIYSFTKTGFTLIEDDVEYTLEEMSEMQATLLLRQLYKITDVIDAFKK